MRSETPLANQLTTLEYFTFAWGTMIGVGWLVVIDDWFERGGPGGAMLGFLIGGMLLVPIGAVYGRLIRLVPDAAGEIAYMEGIFSRSLSFAAGWTMVLAYLIVCPWEAVAIGKILARLFPALDTWPLYSIAGKTIFAPHLLVGSALTLAVAAVNHRGIKGSGRLQNLTTFGLLGIIVLFSTASLARGSSVNLAPAFPRPGLAGQLLSILLVLQIVPYFMTGFESVGKCAEEARPGYDPRGFARAVYMALAAGMLFYVAIIAVVAYVYHWTELLKEPFGAATAFERAFRSERMAALVLGAALLSLIKVFNGNFVASTRLLLGIGRRGLVHRSLASVDSRRKTPTGAIVLVTLVTLVSALLGESVLVPITEVGSLAVGVGWLSACLAYLRRLPAGVAWRERAVGSLGALVAAAIIAMKVVPNVSGHFSGAEWIAFVAWSALGLLFWLLRAPSLVAQEVPIAE